MDPPEALELGSKAESEGGNRYNLPQLALLLTIING